jgi:hypothetical protein
VQALRDETSPDTAASAEEEQQEEEEDEGKQLDINKQGHVITPL